MVEKGHFYVLNNQLTKAGNNREIKILGDLNSRKGKRLVVNKLILGPFGNNAMNENGARLTEMCKQKQLKITFNSKKYMNILGHSIQKISCE